MDFPFASFKKTRCQEFDETLEKRQRGPGCGKKHSTQAMLRHLARQVQEFRGNLERQVGWRMVEAEAPTNKMCIVCIFSYLSLSLSLCIEKLHEYTV